MLLPNPEHEAVDWTTLREREHRGPLEVLVRCPDCGAERWCGASAVRGSIRRGTFTGRCRSDRLRDVRRRNVPLPAHDAVDWTRFRYARNARQQYRLVAVTCPTCKTLRWAPAGWVETKIRRGAFTGGCRSCSTRARQREWIVLSPGRKIDPNRGYIRRFAESIDAEDRPFFDAMKSTTGHNVLEHRLVMARQIRRPLTSYELVDHMDGVKTNNDPSNLRLYRKGRNDPGSSSGYGTYYHEWQMALARVAELEMALAAASSEYGVDVQASSA